MRGWRRPRTFGAMQRNNLRRRASNPKQNVQTALSPSDSKTGMTTQPVAPLQVGAAPEFCTVTDARLLFGIARSSLYQLANEGRIRFIRVRKAGNATGRTLVDCASVRRFLADCVVEDAPDSTPAN